MYANFAYMQNLRTYANLAMFLFLFSSLVFPRCLSEAPPYGVSIVYIYFELNVFKCAGEVLCTVCDTTYIICTKPNTVKSGLILSLSSCESGQYTLLSTVLETLGFRDCPHILRDPG